MGWESCLETTCDHVTGVSFSARRRKLKCNIKIVIIARKGKYQTPHLMECFPECLTALLSLHLDCVSGPCPFGDVHLYPPGLPRLNRTYIWDVKASTKAGLELKFSTPWLRQIEPRETCPDSISYNISSCIDKATVNVGTFCRNGSVSRVKLLGGVIMSLHLPWHSLLTTSGFNIANRASIKREYGVRQLPPADCSKTYFNLSSQLTSQIWCSLTPFHFIFSGSYCCMIFSLVRWCSSGVKIS